MSLSKMAQVAAAPASSRPVGLDVAIIDGVVASPPAASTGAGSTTSAPTTTSTVDAKSTVNANTPDGTPAPEKGRFVKVAAFALVSFTIYAMAIPDNPFEQVADALGINLNVVAGVLVLLTGFTLPRIAAWLDVPAEDADQGSR